MLFDVNNSAEYPDRGLLYDADGGLVPLAVKGDTETGWILLCVLDENLNKFVDEDKGEIKKRWAKFKAPLRIDPLPENFSGDDSKRVMRTLPAAKEIKKL
jgi:hypothetical protein